MTPRPPTPATALLTRLLTSAEPVPPTPTPPPADPSPAEAGPAGSALHAVDDAPDAPDAGAEGAVPDAEESTGPALHAVDDAPLIRVAGAEGAGHGADESTGPVLRAVDDVPPVRAAGAERAARDTAGPTGPALHSVDGAADRDRVALGVVGSAEGRSGRLAAVPGVGRVADFRVGGGGKGPGGRPVRRGPADPVRGVMHRHEVLVAGAVDEWEVAAGLEAHGVTDGAARRLRHRDVFGLAEELYARVPRAVRPLTVDEGERERAWPRLRVGAVQAVPGVLCAIAAGVAGNVRMPVAAALPAVFVAVALWVALRRGPLRIERGGGAAGWTYGLLTFALYGPQALTAARGDGAFDATAGTATFAALTFALVPAAYSAHWLAVRSRAQLAPSHGLSDFADAVRPRLAAALAAYALVLFALLRTATAVAGPAPLAGPAALGLLLFTARLLTVHGFPGPAAAGLAAACAAEALLFAAAPLHLGPGGATAEALVCGAAALALTAQAFRVLPRASAHRPPPRHP